MDLLTETSILRSLTEPSLTASAELGAGLLEIFKGCRILLFSRDGEGCRTVWASQLERDSELWASGLINSTLTDRLTASTAGEWTLVEPTGISWRAGIHFRRPPAFCGGLLLEGEGPSPTEDRLEQSINSGMLSTLMAVAYAIDGRKTSRSVPQLCLPPARKSAASFGSYTGASGASFEVSTFPLAGTPIVRPTSEVFAQFPGIVGKSQILASVLQSVLCAAKSDIPVLIEGESGTGKELIARAIHEMSRRSQLPFVCENCGAVSESLVESELFGHERGAFTGAENRKLGIFEQADGGTVFLDEIGEMDLSLQRKLLRVLQEREVRRVGGQQTIPVDFRLVSATNRVLEELVGRGQFREDLFYRLHVSTINMPALRERPEDIPLLVDHYRQLFAGETGKDPLGISSAAMEALAAYPWPGNVRELRNEIWRHACSERSHVDVEHLSQRILQNLRASKECSVFVPKPLDEIEHNAMAPVLLEALRQAHGNRSRAARMLGITRSVLYRRLHKYKLMGAIVENPK